jgi:hypothetical protein
MEGITENIVQLVSDADYDSFMLLTIFPESEELIQLYKDSAKVHNEKIASDKFYDAGFDLFVPKVTTTSSKHSPCKIDFGVKCCAKLYKRNRFGGYSFTYTPFYTYARSSISNTHLRLANNQGIIDTGYRGNIIGKFDVLSEEPVSINGHIRLLQICGPSLEPIFVNVVDNISELGPSTSRGDGGFGSTGK